MTDVDVETEVRRMLERRAADIVDRQRPLPSLAAEPSSSTTTGGSPPPGLRPRGRFLAVAAVVMGAVGIGGLVIAVRGGDGTSTTLDAGFTTTESAAPTGGEGSGPSSAEAGGADADPDRGPGSLSHLPLDLPASIDLIEGPLVFQDQFLDGPEPAARRYLDDRLPDLPAQLEQVDQQGPLTVFRWWVTTADLDVAGSLVVRVEDIQTGVVLATTDDITITSAERTLDRVVVEVTDTDDDLLAADVTTVHGEIVAGAPDPDGFGDGIGPVFGTAGTTQGDELRIDVEVDPIPVAVRVQNIGGTTLSISEFALDPIGLPEPCGAGPPISIEVGELLGDLQPGPSPRSSGRELLINQQVWHHPGEVASIEIRWPPDPRHTTVVPPSELEASRAVSFETPPGSEPAAGAGGSSASGLALLLVGESALDPCGLVQVSLDGDAAAVEWWTSAISAEWTFGMPLTIAELDPAVGPDGVGPSGGSNGSADADQELVVATAPTATRPEVPAVGSCDGLPDAPPRTGDGPESTTEAPRGALADFLADGPIGDPPLPVGGYTELVIDDARVSYVQGEPDAYYVVIDVVDSGSGWIVEGWSAAPC